MRRFALFVFAVMIMASAGAQTRLTDVLEHDEPGQGTIRVERDARLDQLVGNCLDLELDNKIKATGYRIQVYSGNNSRASRENAEKMEQNMRLLYPQLPVYTVFRSPRWICMVGDYLYYEDAYDTLRKLTEETKQKGFIILRNQEIIIEL